MSSPCHSIFSYDYVQFVNSSFKKKCCFGLTSSNKFQKQVVVTINYLFIKGEWKMLYPYSDIFIFTNGGMCLPMFFRLLTGKIHLVRRLKWWRVLNIPTLGVLMSKSILHEECMFALSMLLFSLLFHPQCRAFYVSVVVSVLLACLSLAFTTRTAPLINI